MTAGPSIDLAQMLHEHLEQASPDLMRHLKLGEEYEGSVNANDYFGGFFQNGNLARAREAGGIDAPTGSQGGGN